MDSRKQLSARRGIRFALRILGRLLLGLLARVNVSDAENYPQSGPLVLACNHVGLMEIVLLGVLPPYDIQFIAAADIPLDPRFAWLAGLWGYIPIKRGMLDREAFRAGAAVLEGKGVLAIFPEGGFWNPGEMEARLGVALLSSMGNAPVIPVGVRGAQGALQAMLRLKRPHLEMAVGEPIAPVRTDQAGLTRKQALEQGARLVMERIHALAGDKPPVSLETRYDIRAALVAGHAQTEVSVPPDLQAALGKFFLHPIILDILRRNLKLPVQALVDLPERPLAGEIGAAVGAVLAYLEVNPGLLTYRFGMDGGLAMQAGLVWLRELAARAQQEGKELYIQPMLFQRDVDGEERLVQERYRPPEGF